MEIESRWYHSPEGTRSIRAALSGSCTSGARLDLLFCQLLQLLPTRERHDFDDQRRTGKDRLVAHSGEYAAQGIPGDGTPTPAGGRGGQRLRGIHVELQGKQIGRLGKRL